MADYDVQPDIESIMAGWDASNKENRRLAKTIRQHETAMHQKDLEIARLQAELDRVKPPAPQPHPINALIHQQGEG